MPDTAAMRKMMKEELHRQYRLHPDPYEAVMRMKALGATVAEVREAAHSLIWEELIEPVEGRSLEAAINTMSRPTRTNPGHGIGRTSAFEEYREHLSDVQDSIRAKLLNDTRENPARDVSEGSQAERAIEAFFEGKEYTSSYIKPTQEQEGGHRDVATYNVHTRESFFKLWDSTIAEMLRGKRGSDVEGSPEDRSWRLELTDAGYPTNTTWRRMENIIRIGGKYHPELKKLRVSFSGKRGGPTVAMKDGKVWKPDPETKMWTIKLKPIKGWNTLAASTEEIVPLELKGSLVEVENAIDRIEREMYEWQNKNDPAKMMDYQSLAARIGKKEELSKLLRKRLKLSGTERTNPTAWRD